MTTIGLDLNKRESQLCIGFDDGRIEERRVSTTRERFTALLGGLARARSWWKRARRASGGRGTWRAWGTK
ncbi:MAG: hypothetical protein ACRENP_26415 [Longimicrobiales bacterium]